MQYAASPYTASPIVFGGQPQLVTLVVDGSPGGLADWVLLGLSVTGGPAVVTLNGRAITYPVTLQPGDTLTLFPQGGATLSSINALAPLREYTPPEPEQNQSDALNVQTDSDGYQTITNADATTDSDGYQTISDTTATADADGFQTVERSNP